MSSQCSFTHALFSQIQYLHWSLSHTRIKTAFQRRKERQSRMENTGSTSVPEKVVFWCCMFNYAVLLRLTSLLSILFHSGITSLPLHCFSVFAPRLPAGACSRTAPRPAPDPAQHRRGAAAARGRFLGTRHLQGRHNDRTGCCATGLVQLGIAEEERQRNKALMWLFVLLNLSG